MTNYVSSIKSLHYSLVIQIRVIYALLMREIITRYGRHNLGFLWLFLEPMIFVGLISLFWGLVRTVRSDIEIIPFAVIGYSVVLCWRNAVGRANKAVSANSSLLYHRNVTMLDVLIARVTLEVYGAFVSFLVLSALFWFLGMMSLPHDFLYMVFGGVLLVWFALALSLTIASLCEMSAVVDRLWSMLSFVLFPVSGVLFFVHWLPEVVREYILYLPMVHLTEMIRHGYYGDIIPTYESVGYIIYCNLVLSFVGLTLLRRVAHKLGEAS